LIYIAYLGSIYNVEFYCRRMKNFWNSNFVNQGGFLFQKLKMACPRDLKAIIVFWVNGWKCVGCLIAARNFKFHDFTAIALRSPENILHVSVARIKWS
jgi:hypothetical protein